jgi:O-antigen ligase
MLPLTPDPAGDIKVLVYELGAFIALALWLFTPAITSPARRKPSALAPFLAAFLVLNVLAGLLSVNVGYSLGRECVKWSALMVIFLVCAEVFNTPRLAWRLVATVCVAVSISSLYGIVQFMGWDPFPWENLGDTLRSAPATFGNPNFASHVVLPSTVLAIGLCTQSRGRWAAGCAVIFLAHFALTQTRGSLLALGATVLFAATLWIVSRRVKRASRTLVITLCSVCVVTLIGLVTVGAAFSLRTGQPFPDDPSTTYRYHSFYGACQLIQDKPWLGHGPGMYRVVNPVYWSPLEQQRFLESNQMNFHVHNEPLEIAVEAGIAAAVAYLGVLVLGMYYGVMMGFRAGDPARRRVGLTLATVFLALLVDGFFGFNVHVPASAVLVCMLAGITAGVWRERTEPIERASTHGGWLPAIRRAGVAVCAAFIAFVAICDFGAQLFSQRGKDARHHEASVAAAQSFDKAMTLAPYDWLHPFDLSVVALDMNRPDEGERLLNQSLTLNPHFVSAQLAMGKALLNTANGATPDQRPDYLKKVIAHASPLAEEYSSFPEAHDVLGRAQFLLANWHMLHTDSDPSFLRATWRNAEEELERSAALGSEEAENLNTMLAMSRLAREEVPDTGPTDDAAPLHRYRAKILHASYGDEAAAERVYVHTANWYPNDIETWAAFYAFATATQREARFANALRKAAMASTETLPAPALAVARAYEPDAEAVTVAATELIAALSNHLTTNNDALLTAQQFGWAADALLARTLDVDLTKSARGMAFYQLGLVYEAGGDLVNALQRYDDAVAYAPTLFDARLALAQALALDEQWEKARAEYGAMLDLFSLNEEGRALIEQRLSELPS